MWTEFLSISFKSFGFAFVIFSTHFYPWMIFRALPPDDVSTYISFNDLTKSHDADLPLHHPSALWWESSTASTICLPNSSDLHNLQVLLGQILRDRRAATFWWPPSVFQSIASTYSLQTCVRILIPAYLSLHAIFTLKYPCLFWRVRNCFTRFCFYFFDWRMRRLFIHMLASVVGFYSLVDWSRASSLLIHQLFSKGRAEAGRRSSVPSSFCQQYASGPVCADPWASCPLICEIWF